ncbi:MAG: pentapeptide repeat-containing protein [Ferrimicrobium sp.]
MFAVPSANTRLIALGSIIAGVGVAYFGFAISTASGESLRKKNQSDHTAEELRKLKTRRPTSGFGSAPELDLSHSFLDGVVELTGIDLRGCRLVQVEWHGPILDEAKFSSTDDVETDLSVATLLLKSAKKAVFSQANLHLAILGGNFRHADFTRVKAVDCDFRKAWLRNAQFRAAYLKGTRFDGNLTLAGVDFTAAICEDAHFEKSRITEDTRFDLAFLGNAHFDHSTLGEISFKRATFSDVYGQGAASFSGACFDKRCDFGGAWIVGVDFTRTRGLENCSFEGALAVEGHMKFPAAFDPTKRGVVVMSEGTDPTPFWWAISNDRKWPL